MFDLLPQKYDRKWFLIALVYAAVIFVSMLLGTTVLLDRDMNPANIPSIALVSLAISCIICLFGFFNARWLFVCSSGGLVIAISLMIMVFLENGATGWEDLIGIMSFFMMLILGVGVGIIAELVAFLMPKFGKGDLRKIKPH